MSPARRKAQRAGPTAAVQVVVPPLGLRDEAARQALIRWVADMLVKALREHPGRESAPEGESA